MELTLADFEYSLPPERVAQIPMDPRDQARLLVSRGASVEDRVFTELAGLLRPGDHLVLNDTRVIPARLLGRRATGGRVEIFLLEPAGPGGVWHALGRSGKPLRPGLEVFIAPGFSVRLLERDGAQWQVVLVAEDSPEEALARWGSMPLPPYIRTPVAERDLWRYQTVFARQDGAVAAPTAGLHFTTELLERLAQAGIGSTRVTLHVGLGTFQPVRVERLDDHVMHAERYELTAAAAQTLNRVRRAGGRLVAVGTTAVRVLETCADSAGVLHPEVGSTRLFIRPGYRFRAVDAMITNFHLPRSTLLMLVAAFVGYERWRRDYAHALGAGYRFFSYGDATLLFP
ncbi:MAG: tRNA preQ1(34) S-adenosylmethionine ribosyltransferase-isomerase QueA [Magnetococcus sp. WYHC-3]